MDQSVKRKYRDAITGSAERWARVPTGSYPCPWCVMLASRGFVYRSEEAAGGHGQYHAYCYCALIPAKDSKSAHIDGYDPDALRELYRKGEGIGEQSESKEAYNTSGMYINKPPIDTRQTATGNPSAILHHGADLSDRQKALLKILPRADAETIVHKNDVSMKDLAALTAQTNSEYAMFTRGAERLVVRGDSAHVYITPERARDLKAKGYKFSGHTHIGTGKYDLIPSEGDVTILGCFGQKNSVISLPTGEYAIFSTEE